MDPLRREPPARHPPRVLRPVGLRRSAPPRSPGSLGRDGLAAATAGRSAVGGLPGLPHFAPKAKHVIYLFQNGAPTHVELFDYKPTLTQLHGTPVPEASFAGKRFSTMTGNPQGQAPARARSSRSSQHGQSGAWVSALPAAHRRRSPTTSASSRACTPTR